MPVRELRFINDTYRINTDLFQKLVPGHLPGLQIAPRLALDHDALWSGVARDDPNIENKGFPRNIFSLRPQ